MDELTRETISFQMAVESISELCVNRFVEKSKDGRTGWETATSSDLIGDGFLKLMKHIQANDLEERKKSMIDTLNFFIMSFDEEFNNKNSEIEAASEPEDTIKLMDKIIESLQKEKQKIVEEQLSAISKN